MPEPKELKKDFYLGDTLEIAQSLLGKFLFKPGFGAYMITEVEAYDGEDDKASHASRKRTQRNEVMFWEGGYIYVYLVYGMHNMLNIVTGPRDYPAAILIRGIDKCQGPGKLTKLLGIDRSLNKQKIYNNELLKIEDKGFKIKKEDIEKGPRVGVDYAGPIWSQKKYRFWIA